MLVKKANTYDFFFYLVQLSKYQLSLQQSAAQELSGTDVLKT